MARAKGTVTQPDMPQSPGPGKGNQNGVTFGHRSAEIALRKGLPFKPGSLADTKLQELRERLHADGILSIVEDNVQQMQAIFETWCAATADKVANMDTKDERRTMADYINWSAKINKEWWRLHEEAKGHDAGNVMDAAIVAAEELVIDQNQ